MPKGQTYPRCFDPYLRYAISTGFRDFEFFDRDHRLFFLVEFNQTAGAADDFEKAMKHHSDFDATFGPADDKTRYATMRARTSAVLEADALRIWDLYVSRVELSLPVKPAPLPIIFLDRPIDRFARGKDPVGPLLIGVLDDGCPFAAAQFRRISASPPISTRVRGIWDQNQGKQPVSVKDSAGNQKYLFGQTLPDFRYGLEFWRDFAAPGDPPREMGLDEWMGLHVTPAGSVDEDRCYADAGFTSLKFRESHGAHVMDVFAGSIPTSSRIGPSGGDRRDPPSWNAGDPTTDDPACGADLVFVQFPDSGIRDASGVWLKAYVVDGIRYILSFADPVRTKNVIINLSYGPTTGPHDGTAVLEAALTALVAYFNGTPNKPKLEIALAAGNSYLTEGHVVFSRDDSQPDHVA